LLLRLALMRNPSQPLQGGPLLRKLALNATTTGNFGRLRGLTGAVESFKRQSRVPLLALLGVALSIAPALPSAAQTSKTSTVTIAGGEFMRDGKPYQIISGAIHYPRVPREYWRDRLRKAHAMGLNTVETYAFWNVHEPREGVFDFSGNNDIAAFARMAQNEGLNVIVRPGPYVCAEWEAGGLPAWLFADPSIKVRTRDPRFLAATDRYLARLGRELAPLQATHGGPIIAVQVENEYGTYGNDRLYMEQIRQSLVRAGFGDSILFTSDGPKYMVHDALPGVLPVINFGPGKAERSYATRFLAMLYLASTMRSFLFEQPWMTGEYWAGWYDAWGGQHARTDAELQAKELDWMLGQGYSVSLYMFHGGTSFGFMNGANYGDGGYLPLVTSYDYDAALDEAGRPTRKFYLFRDVIQRRTGFTPPALPAPLPIAEVASFPLGESASLWSNLPAPVSAEHPRSMETFGQDYGYILYRTELTGPVAGRLVVDDLRDFAAVYLNHKLQGTLDRRLKQTGLDIVVPAGPVTLDILVENTGRVNYGPQLQDGQAGITRSVSLAGRALSGWQVYSLPMTGPEGLKGWQTGFTAGPAFHRGTFTIASVADTYLDVSRLGKGFAWVNGHNLGRVWRIGPQQSLFLPAPWLKMGVNQVVVFDFNDLDGPRLRGAGNPIWSK
jgi:beta-galactosidase